MSNVVHAIVVPVDPKTATDVISKAGGLHNLTIAPLAGSGSVIYETKPDPAREFSDRMDQLGEQLSKEIGRSLVVGFDDRVGFRFSRLIENGTEIRQYGPDDEIWVLLDEYGDAGPDGPRFYVTQLDPSEEYETIQNAIQLGLADIGCGTWEEILNIV